MKNILIIIIPLLLLSGCSNKITPPANTEESGVVTESSASKPILTYNDSSFEIYSFGPGGNNLDLNFDGIDDYIFVSHITGADYYDYHTNANKDIYNFYINYANTEQPNSFNIVTKEIPNKKIFDFERDFVIAEQMGCNGGQVLRVAKTKNETFIIIASENQGEKDGANTRAIFNIYKLGLSGEIRGSDNIFKFVKSIVGESVGCGVEELMNKDIVGILKKVTAPLDYNRIINSKIGEPKNGYYKSAYGGEVIEWRGKISSYYSQITGIKFCVSDKDHQAIEMDKPCDWFWAFSDKLMSADDIITNPSWDGNWVNYILNYYKVAFDKNSNFYNDIYTVKGFVNGIDCVSRDQCAPDIDIINISK